MAFMMATIEGPRRRRVHRCRAPPNQVRQVVYENAKLNKAAREAKERLDEKLNSLWISHHKRKTKECQEPKPANGLLKKSGWSKRLSWTSKWKWKWKCLEREECAVCLEALKGGQTLMQLPCNHTFHSRCLMPWLQINGHCPYCRLQILLA